VGSPRDQGARHKRPWQEQNHFTEDGQSIDAVDVQALSIRLAVEPATHDVGELEAVAVATLMSFNCERFCRRMAIWWCRFLTYWIESSTMVDLSRWIIPSTTTTMSSLSFGTESGDLIYDCFLNLVAELQEIERMIKIIRLYLRAYRKQSLHGGKTCYSYYLSIVTLFRYAQFDRLLVSTSIP
jgi:hypothetical protein